METSNSDTEQIFLLTLNFIKKFILTMGNRDESWHAGSSFLYGMKKLSNFPFWIQVPKHDFVSAQNFCRTHGDH